LRLHLQSLLQRHRLSLYPRQRLLQLQLAQLRLQRLQRQHKQHCTQVLMQLA
jgi:hypothetical protein